MEGLLSTGPTPSSFFGTTSIFFQCPINIKINISKSLGGLHRVHLGNLLHLSTIVFAVLMQMAANFMTHMG